VKEGVQNSQVVRFATFEVDLLSVELRKAGVKLKLTGQPFQVLAILLEQPGTIVTREELQKRLWPDTFVDVDHNLNTAIKKIREALGDSAEHPRFVETLPRRGYRFVGRVEGNRVAAIPTEVSSNTRRWALRPFVLVGACVACVLMAAAGLFLYKRTHVSVSHKQRSLTRLTFDDGLQIGATWSPDGRFIAYRTRSFVGTVPSLSHGILTAREFLSGQEKMGQVLAFGRFQLLEVLLSSRQSLRILQNSSATSP
jgi:DNA-binding winged helix-turn-helix (wHTH) protein